MYDRAETSRARQAFWTAFGQYMAPQLSAEGERISWSNYKTGERQVHFKMQAGTKAATIAVEITHADAYLQQLYFEQFLQLKNLLEQYLSETWNWQLHTTNEWGQTISRISKEQQNVNIMNRNDWPQLISFFKPRIIGLDAFWCDVKYTFEALR